MNEKSKIKWLKANILMNIDMAARLDCNSESNFDIYRKIEGSYNIALNILGDYSLSDAAEFVCNGDFRTHVNRQVELMRKSNSKTININKNGKFN